MKANTSNRILVLFTAALVSLSANAQVTVKVGESDDDKVKISAMGRVYFDGASYFEDDTKLSNGTTISDVRIGLKSVYKKWDAKLDMGYANGKVNMKDIHLRYTINNNSFVKLGYYGEYFGNECWQSTAGAKFNGHSTSADIFGTGRKIGISYLRYGNKYWMAVGVSGDGDAINNSVEGDDGYAGTGRFVFVPFKENGKIFHVGLSGTIRKADANGYNDEGGENRRKLTYSSPFGTTTIEKRKALQATVTDVKYQAKYGVEMLASVGKMFVLGEYFHSNVKRKDGLPTYKASGGYVMAGFLLIGQNYTYASTDSHLRAPKPGSLELIARFNYVDLDNHNTGIYGGRMKDWALGLNYYLNKFVTFKANYSYIQLGNRAYTAPGETVQALQARIMVAF